jgi:AcrR family transcriptional regulator
MPRPSQVTQRRAELLPIVARAFAEHGYRRTTTAELARRCGVRENILYRLWPDKKAMFIAAIQYVYELSEATWERLLREAADGSPAERLLAYESAHHGEFGHYRIVFAGLSEADDPDIRQALAGMYRRFQRFLERQIAAHRGRTAGHAPAAGLSAWGVIGVGTVANIARELGLISKRQRARLIAEIGRYLLNG